jgi:formylmethanofuran dehydrogenase subunit C
VKLINNRGNILVIFIILIVLSISLFSFISLIGTRLKESGVKVKDSAAFYAADAGLNKAIWYLATPVSQGGKGLDWRVSASWESFGAGGYRFTIANWTVTDEAIIISTGEVGNSSKTVSQLVRIGGLPSAFDYGVYCNSGVDFSGNVLLKGDIYVNDDTEFSTGASATDGYVYHPSGTTLSGDGTWTDGGAPDPLPSFPAFDSSYYDNLIVAAGAVPSGDLDYSNETIDLAGGIVYVNGDVSITNNTTFNGPGVIVATGTINISGNTYTSDDVTFISNDELSVTGNTYTSSSTYYSATSIAASGNTRVEVGSFLTTGAIKLSGNLNLSGLIYAESGASTIIGNPTITGSLVVDSFKIFSGNANVYFDPSKLPAEAPDGFSSSTLTVVKGSWKGY